MNRIVIVSTLAPAREQDPSDSRSIAAMVRQSARYHEAGRTDEAESGYRQVLALVPDHPAALRHLGRLLVQTDRYAEAEPVFERLASASPGA